MKNLTILFFLFSGMCFLLWGCSSVTDPALMYQNESSTKIYQRGRTALLRNNYQEAINCFEALNVQYPLDEQTERAQLYLIYAYYMKEDYLFSIATSDQFIRNYPANPHIDYAYYMKGISNYYQSLGMLERFFAVDLARRDLTAFQKAYEDFMQLYERFPNSPYRDAAYQQMIYLRNMLALHELEVAQYYFHRAAYVAAANRASVVLLHYQRTPAVYEALRLMAKSYHALGERQLEKDIRLVMQLNGVKLSTVPDE